MDEEKKSARGTSPAAVIALLSVLIGLPILYLLSIGPVAAYYHDRVAPNWLNTFYHPIGLLAQHSPIFAEVLEWYFSLWLN